MYDNDHVPTPPPLYSHELNLLVIGDVMAWMPAFVVPALQNLVIGEEDDSNESNHQLQGKAQREDTSEANRCRGCPMWSELLCERPDCRHAPSNGDCREGD